MGISYLSSLIMAKTWFYIISLVLRLLSCEVGRLYTIISILGNSRYRKIAFSIRFIKPISLSVKEAVF